MRTLLVAALGVIVISLPSGAQKTAVPLDPSSATVNNDFIQKRFSSTCTLLPDTQPLIADLDGDSIQDVVIVAHCKNPMIDQTENNFDVVDPYNTFYGYGDTKVTSQFASEDPALRGMVLLIIHGSGAEAWRSDTPKAKFVILNLPFKHVTVKRLRVKKKKKPMMAIFAEESGSDQMNSVIFWDGKHYKYQPLGSSQE
ncbi:MAG: hypothetical protein M3O09_11235 [Acidobacteriota bacterium]|nr:hypothetical protein [Acidobacteriota bacterium]